MSTHVCSARLSAALGRPITHTQIPVEGVRASMRESAVPQWNVDGLTELFAPYETGHAGGVSPDIERVLGRKACGIDDVIRDHRAAFGG